MKKNNIVYGEMDAADRQMLNIFGIENCVVRRPDGWWPCVNKTFKDNLTYRLHNNVKKCIRLEYKIVNGLWMAHGVTYGNSASLAEIDGIKVKFVGYYRDGVVTRDQLPVARYGVWECLE